MENSHIDIDPEIPRNAVSIYGNNDAMDDFPVLKAFQQYIDAEHAKEFFLIQSIFSSAFLPGSSLRFSSPC